MRLTVLAAPLLLASSTLAHSPLRRGQATDTCANLNADLAFDVEVDGKPYVAGHIHAGVCIKQLDTFIGHYNVTEAAVKVVGVDKVKSTLTDMIKKAGVECTYPPHAKSSVTNSNVCGFVCTDGFLAMPVNHPSSCICPPQETECDGKCGHFLPNCPATPPPSRRQNDPKCAKGLSMCGVPGATSGEAYKCTDVTSDSYTCGGCVKPSPFGSPSTVGVNCHLIPNVDEVSCRDSKCFVHTCKTGFTVSTSNDGCVPKPYDVRAVPVPGADQVIDAATRPIHAVAREALGETIAPSSVTDKVPRADAASGVIKPLLSSGKASLNGAQSSVPHGLSTRTKFHRGIVPLKGHGTNVRN